MSRHITKPLAVLATAAVLAPAGAMAAGDDATTIPSLKIKGAYAYVENSLPGGKSYASVVVQTAGPLPRRFDGMLRASGSLDGTAHSLGSVRGAKGKKANCYTFLAEIKDGKIRGLKGKRANVGSKHTVVISARGTDGDLTASKTVTLRKKLAGDTSGKPLGC